MKTVFLLSLLIRLASANTISYKGFIEKDQIVYTLDVPYSYAKDRLNQRKLPLDGRYYDGKFTGKGVDVYVVDTGISKNIFYNFTCGHNFIGDRCDCSTTSIHGTHVGSLISSSAFGIAPGSNIVNLKVLDDQGFGLLSNVIKAIDYLLARNVTCSIINMSLGSGKSDILNLKVGELVKAGNRVVVAAGNGGSDACLSSPASAPDAITVGAVDQNDKRTKFSNRGNCVDVYAPGFKVLGATSGNSFEYLSGTSMSSPLIAGVLALHMEKNGCNARLKRTRVKRWIKIGFTGN